MKQTHSTRICILRILVSILLSPVLLGLAATILFFLISALFSTAIEFLMDGDDKANDKIAWNGPM